MHPAEPHISLTARFVSPYDEGRAASPFLEVTA